MNYLTAITTILVALLGAMIEQKVLPEKWAGWAVVIAAVIQAFQGQIHKKRKPKTAELDQEEKV